jgi:DNA repair photolyase
MSKHYTNPLSLTSQFFFCGLPLRLDSYRGCGFQCSFCFARYRGGNAPNAAILPADPNTLERIFNRTIRHNRNVSSGVIGQLLEQRVPIHFGGMSDPFQQVEERFRVTQRFLDTLLKFQYPTVISTRSTLVGTSPYLDRLRDMKSVVVQFSFTSSLSQISSRLEPHSPNPSELLKTMELLSGNGIPVTCRWQPYVPGVSEPPSRFVQNVANVGAQHIALEHLKLPVETNHPLWSQLLTGAGRDLRSDYLRLGAKLAGREYVLPAHVKLPTILEVRDNVHKAGLSFGVADNEFQYLSDTDCCCSGVDRFPGFEGWFKHQVAHAVRCSRGKQITYETIASYWAPDSSVDRWLNSHSRIGNLEGNQGTLKEHLQLRWNDPNSPLSPTGFYGVLATDEFTPLGFRVYEWRRDLDPRLT